MYNCIRCGLPLYQSDRQSRELILCCIFAQKICPTCLADFVDQEEPQILSICQRCGKKIKLSDLHRKYSLYTNNIDRIMASSRVRYGGEYEGMGGGQMKRGGFCGGFEGFGMKGFGGGGYQGGGGEPGMGIKFSKGFNNKQVPTQIPPQMMFNNFNGGHPRVQQIDYCNYPNQPQSQPRHFFKPHSTNQHFGQIYYQQGYYKPLINSMQDLNISNGEQTSPMEVQAQGNIRQGRFPQMYNYNNNKGLGYEEKHQGNQIRQIYQPSFGHSNYFAHEAASRKKEMERHQRSLSSHGNRGNGELQQQQQQRPLSSNSRVCRVENRNEKSPPSFGKA